MTDLGNAEISWTNKLENYFASTGERAHCMSWAHIQAESLFQFRRTFIDLPVIVLSSITGFLSVGSGSLFPDTNASAGLGAMSLFVAILNTLGTYYSWAKKSEAHRIASLHYAKLYRFISVEMALPREERISAKDFLKYIKEQYDRLAETSPAIPDKIVEKFLKKFHSSLHDISLPEQMNGLEAIHIYNEGDLRKDLELEANIRTLHESFKFEEVSPKFSSKEVGSAP